MKYEKITENIRANEVEPDIFETVTEYIRNNPGCKLRELRSNTKWGTSAKTQEIKDAIDEGIIETKYENNN